MSLIKPERVTIVRRSEERDEVGDVVGEIEETEEVRVVVCPGATADLDASRPNGVKVAYTLHLPKGYGRSLRGCTAVVRGEAYAVVGDPQPYTDANTPGGYSLPAEVARADG